MKTYKITFESNIGMFSFYYTHRYVTAANETEAREQAQAWIKITPERDNVAIESVIEMGAA